MIKTIQLKLIIFWISITFIILTILSLTIGQILPYEFADYEIMHTFYDIIMQGFPIAILLTLFGTIKQKNTKLKNGLFVFSTVLLSILSFALMISLIFKIGFGSWVTIKTIYKHKTENKTINEQFFDVGAFGYSGQRTVKIEPILKYWILPTAIDTSEIDKENWILVNEEGKFKFP